MGSFDYTNERAVSHEDMIHYRGASLAELHRQKTIAAHPNNINATMMDDSNIMNNSSFENDFIEDTPLKRGKSRFSSAQMR
jgi:hypothetical protein